MILRRTPIRRKRRTLRRGELTLAEKQAVRREVYERSGGCCELGFEGCIKGVLPWDGEVWTRAHLAHIVGKGAGGAFTALNTRLSCWKCHLIGCHLQGGNGKIVPAKEYVPVEKERAR